MKNKGFTLIELMIVIAIFGIMATIAIPVFFGIGSSGATNASYSLNGRIEERCIGDYTHTIDANGIAHQIISEHGGGVRCQ